MRFMVNSISMQLGHCLKCHLLILHSGKAIMENRSIGVKVPSGNRERKLNFTIIRQEAMRATFDGRSNQSSQMQKDGVDIFFLSLRIAKCWLNQNQPNAVWVDFEDVTFWFLFFIDSMFETFRHPVDMHECVWMYCQSQRHQAIVFIFDHQFKSIEQ